MDRAFHNLAYQNNDGPAEFVEFGRAILESEDLTDAVYAALIAMLKDKYGGERSEVDIGDFGRLFINGVYIPCERRVALIGELDLRNDTLPDFCAMADPREDSVSFYTATKLGKLPIGISAIKRGIPYRVATIYQQNNELQAIPHYITVSEDGAIQHCINRSRFPFPRGMSYFVATSCVALSAAADARFLWQVKTKEKLLANRETPVTLGIGAEAVKSLFYARQEPLTETGRKRPILHWVRAHQRRIREGIDVDIRKHLRGITRFEMHGLEFEITSPTKAKEQNGTET